MFESRRCADVKSESFLKPSLTSTPHHTHATHIPGHPLSRQPKHCWSSKRSPHIGSWRPHFVGRSSPDVAVQGKRNHCVFTHRCAPTVTTPILDFCLRLSWSSNRKAIFFMKSLRWHPKTAFDDFPDIWCPPLKRASWLHDFTFYSFLSFFRDPISPIYSILRWFYQARKSEPKKVTKSYEKLQTTYEKLAKSYKKLRKSYERVTKSYEKLQKVTNELRKSYERVTKN